MRFNQFLHLLQEPVVVSRSVKQVRNKEQQRLLGPLDEVFLRIIQRHIIVFSTAELRAKEDLDRVNEVRCHIRYGFIVEKGQPSLQNVERSKDSSHDRAVDDAHGHGTGLVDQDDHVTLSLPTLVGEK